MGEIQMTDQIIEATIEAVGSVMHPRLFESERGYHGQFYYELQRVLEGKGLWPDYLLEMEYQKSARHGLSQRPDIVFHIPQKVHGGRVEEHNWAVFELKRKASNRTASDDFEKLDDMIARLSYRLAIFINIASAMHRLDQYQGPHRDRVHALAVQRVENALLVKHACFRGDQLVEEHREMLFGE